MATARTQPIRPESREQAIARSTMLLLLGAEGVFFLTLVMVALYLRTNELHSQFAAFRPSLLLPVTNTVVLGCSAFTMWWAHRSVGHDRTTMLRRLLLVTILCGVFFVGGQVVEFLRSGMAPWEEGLGGLFFTLLGFHATHVVAGMIVLSALLIRAYLGDFDAESHVAVTMGAWFWYFVTAVWAVLFYLLYL